MKTIKLTEDQIKIMFLAIKICRDDYQNDFEENAPGTRHIYRRLSEVENKLVKALHLENQSED
jgi:hypothetical protein